jgi:hypothetical protein
VYSVRVGLRGLATLKRVVVDFDSLLQRREYEKGKFTLWHH